jgi:hypothetical protein
MGRPKGMPKEPMLVKVPVGMVNRVKHVALDNNMTMSEFVEIAIRYALLCDNSVDMMVAQGLVKGE